MKKPGKRKHNYLLTIFLFFFVASMANVKLPYVLSSNMVLQRETETNIWGWADANEKIEISFRDKTYQTNASINGLWNVKVTTGKAGGPFQLLIKAKNTIKLENILIGDIWVCSGQSNMEWPLINSKTGETEVAHANYPNIRLLQVAKNASPIPVDNIAETQWQVCTPESVPDFSAVGYFFGKKIHIETGVPIGLISSNWGGTIIETWISSETAKSDQFMTDWINDLVNLDINEMKIEQESKFKLYHKELKKVQSPEFKHKYINNNFDDAKWHTISQPQLWEVLNDFERFNGVVWYRKTFEIPESFNLNNVTLSIARIDDSDITWLNGVKVGETYNKYNLIRIYQLPADVLQKDKNQLVVRVEDYTGGGGFHGDASDMFVSDGINKIDLAGEWKLIKDETPTPRNPNEIEANVLMPNEFPTLLFNGMIHPLLNYAIKGAIWYQGESNADAMSQALRYEDQLRLMISDWRKQWGNDSLSFYLVQLANFKNKAAAPQNDIWPFLREAQAKVANDENVEMACIIDIGEANDIHPRNKADVGNRLALKALSENYSKGVVSNGPRFFNVEFEGNKAVVSFNVNGSNLISKSDNRNINGFSVAGNDKIFHYANAQLLAGNKVEITSDILTEIVAVRYLWADNPGEINLYNSVGLPAEPFRTDKW